MERTHFKSRSKKESRRETRNNDGVRIVNAATWKSVKSPGFPHRNIHKCTFTFPDGRIQSD